MADLNQILSVVQEIQNCSKQNKERFGEINSDNELKEDFTLIDIEKYEQINSENIEKSLQGQNLDQFLLEAQSMVQKLQNEEKTILQGQDQFNTPTQNSLKSKKKPQRKNKKSDQQQQLQQSESKFETPKNQEKQLQNEENSLKFSTTAKKNAHNNINMVDDSLDLDQGDENKIIINGGEESDFKGEADSFENEFCQSNNNILQSSISQQKTHHINLQNTKSDWKQYQNSNLEQETIEEQVDRLTTMIQKLTKQQELLQSKSNGMVSNFISRKNSTSDQKMGRSKNSSFNKLNNGEDILNQALDYSGISDKEVLVKHIYDHKTQLESQKIETDNLNILLDDLQLENQILKKQKATIANANQQQTQQQQQNQKPEEQEEEVKQHAQNLVFDSKEFSISIKVKEVSNNYVYHMHKSKDGLEKLDLALRFIQENYLMMDELNNENQNQQKLTRNRHASATDIQKNLRDFSPIEVKGRKNTEVLSNDIQLKKKHYSVNNSIDGDSKHMLDNIWMNKSNLFLQNIGQQFERQQNKNKYNNLILQQNNQEQINSNNNNNQNNGSNNNNGFVRIGMGIKGSLITPVSKIINKLSGKSSRKQSEFNFSSLENNNHLLQQQKHKQHYSHSNHNNNNNNLNNINNNNNQNNIDDDKLSFVQRDFLQQNQNNSNNFLDNNYDDLNSLKMQSEQHHYINRGKPPLTGGFVGIKSMMARSPSNNSNNNLQQQQLNLQNNNYINSNFEQFGGNDDLAKQIKGDLINVNDNDDDDDDDAGINNINQNEEDQDELSKPKIKEKQIQMYRKLIKKLESTIVQIQQVNNNKEVAQLLVKLERERQELLAVEDQLILKAAAFQDEKMLETQNFCETKFTQSSDEGNRTNTEEEERINTLFADDPTINSKQNNNNNNGENNSNKQIKNIGITLQKKSSGSNNNNKEKKQKQNQSLGGMFTMSHNNNNDSDDSQSPGQKFQTPFFENNNNNNSDSD